MTIDSIISRLNQYSSWLYNRHWERWEILTIVIVALFLLLLVLRAKRKAKINTTRYMSRYTPVIGIRLVQGRARH